MKFKLFEEVILMTDIVKSGLRRGDVATVVEYHSVPYGEDGYSLEVFNVLGDTIAVITVVESAIAPLAANQVFHVRALPMAA